MFTVGETGISFKTWKYLLTQHINEEYFTLALAPENALKWCFVRTYYWS